MTFDQKALETAKVAVDSVLGPTDNFNADWIVERAITAYLNALPASDHAGLVEYVAEKIKAAHELHGRSYTRMAVAAIEAAKAISAGVQTNAEARLAEAERLLTKSANAMGEAQDWFEAEFSDADFDANSNIASIDADLYVATYEARAFLQSLGKEE